MTIWRASLDKAECQQLLDVGVQVFIAVFFSTTVFCHKKKKKKLGTVAVPLKTHTLLLKTRPQTFTFLYGHVVF